MKYIVTSPIFPHKTPGITSCDRLAKGLRRIGFLILLVAVLFAYPSVILAYRYFDPLDRYPYLLCAGIGVIILIVSWIGLRKRVFGRNTNHLKWILPVGTFIVPFLFMSVGITANVWLDRSPPVRHTVKALRWERRGKGPGICTVQSWRGKEVETLVGREPPLMGCKSGSRLIITARAGAFGWEWVEKAE